MSLHLLDVEPCDVRAEALGLLLGAPAPAALAEITLDDGAGATLVLGVLGASHVVTASTAAQIHIEQVSCDAVVAGGQELPARAEADGYVLTSAVSHVGRAEIDAVARDLRARAAADPAWLCGAFPGDDAALTALTGTPLPEGGWTWRTWHLYPGEQSTIVTTQSTWTPR